MSLNRETSGRARSKCHDLNLSGIDRDFDVISVQVDSGATVSGPAEFDSFVLLHLDSLHIVGNPPIFDAQIKAACLGGSGLCLARAGTATQCSRNDSHNDR